MTNFIFVLWSLKIGIRDKLSFSISIRKSIKSLNESFCLQLISLWISANVVEHPFFRFLHNRFHSELDVFNFVFCRGSWKTLEKVRVLKQKPSKFWYFLILFINLKGRCAWCSGRFCILFPFLFRIYIWGYVRKAWLNLERP